MILSTSDFEYFFNDLKLHTMIFNDTILGSVFYLL